MTRITTSCPQCGTVVLDADDLMLVVSPLEGLAWYQFDCTGCASQVSKPAPDAVVGAMIRVRIPVRVVPAEVLERRADVEESGPLGADHLLDLMLWLRTHDHLAALEGAPATTPRA